MIWFKNVDSNQIEHMCDMLEQLLSWRPQSGLFFFLTHVGMDMGHQGSLVVFLIRAMATDLKKNKNLSILLVLLIDQMKI